MPAKNYDVAVKSSFGIVAGYGGWPSIITKYMKKRS
jgi:hypothetical protein